MICPHPDCDGGQITYEGTTNGTGDTPPETTENCPLCGGSGRVHWDSSDVCAELILFLKVKENAVRLGKAFAARNPDKGAILLDALNYLAASPSRRCDCFGCMLEAAYNGDSEIENAEGTGICDCDKPGGEDCGLKIEVKAMSDIGETFDGLRAEGQDRRARNRSSSPNMLKGAGFDFEEKNNGAHLIVFHNGVTADFWPGTGLYAIRPWRRSPTRRGVRNLIRDLYRAQSPQCKPAEPK